MNVSGPPYPGVTTTFGEIPSFVSWIVSVISYQIPLARGSAISEAFKGFFIRTSFDFIYLSENRMKAKQSQTFPEPLEALHVQGGKGSPNI